MKSEYKQSYDNLSGHKIREQNIKECLKVFDLIKTSLGPISMDKLIINEVGDMIVTNDGANILKCLEIKHPATKILVNLANQQDEEVGDGTTSVVLLASELLKRADVMIKNKIHSSVIISAFRLAMCYSSYIIREKLSLNIDNYNFKVLLNVAKTSLSSKISGINAKKFSTFTLEAVKSVKNSENYSKKFKCQLKIINFIKIEGQGINMSRLIDGCAISGQKIIPEMSNQISPARIICFDSDLKRSRMKLGVQIEGKFNKNIEKIVKKETEIVKKKVLKLAITGINVVLTSKGIDDFVVKLFHKNGIIAVRRVSLDDLKRIAISCGTKVQKVFHSNKFKDTKKSVYFGVAEEIFEQDLNSFKFITIRGCSFCPGNSILLRGANTYLLEEMSRSLVDSISVLKRTIEGKKLVAGGGSCETALSILLEKLSNSVPSREQLPISEYGEALMTIPKILVTNAGINDLGILAKLRVLHLASSGKKNYRCRYYGLDLSNGRLQNNILSGIIEPAMSKIKSIQMATEAAITILRIDDFVVL